MQQPSLPMAQISPANITTEQIQKYLDENKQLILAILDNQNLGKLAECAQYQAQLQKNLLYLAAIADAQPPTPSVRPQVAPLPQPSMQQGAPFIMQQNPAFSPRPLMQFNPQQLHDQQQQQHRLMNFPPHMGMRPGVMNGLQAMQQAMHHSQSSYGAGGEIPLGSAMAELPRGSVSTSRPMDGQASKQDTGRADPSNDGQRGAAEHGSGEVVEPAAYMKRQEDCKT
ncbi:GRF1-interacting factor 3 [Platanthera guangdongensis]|uniref:GRF1-interacting factor 3 n=1 Tax=Platanthera guangdongensis TaxID=2320717 RepID=A0ABR2MNZ3_9ASPA